MSAVRERAGVVGASTHPGKADDRASGRITIEDGVSSVYLRAGDATYAVALTASEARRLASQLRAAAKRIETP